MALAKGEDPADAGFCLAEGINMERSSMSFDRPHGYK
jgi:hypothetical protein